ncbi:MAG: hypothetical protein IKI30_03655 [Oxalobacter sp.]|nr:hypothetical protein [Oxalobacter sp.]
MKASPEVSAATAMLIKVLETQPNIIQDNKGKASGRKAAEFCLEFIKTYENSLKKEEEKQSQNKQ